MTTTAINRDVPGIYRPVTYVPGGARFSLAASERRYDAYRTWLGSKDMGWCAECLLCGEWTSSQQSRGHADAWGSDRHPGTCHVVNGCHCPQPHITAAMGARLGLGAEYPRRLGTVLFKMAGGRRKYRPPSLDLHRTPFGAPEGTYYYWR